jgi:hypothetical protein
LDEPSTGKMCRSDGYRIELIDRDFATPQDPDD